MNPLAIGRALLGGLKLVPAWVWIILALAILYRVGVDRHDAAIQRVRDDAYAMGVSDTRAEFLAAQRQAAAAAAAINSKIRKKSDEENRAIARDADAVRLHGPGKAVCPGIAAAPSPASGHVPAGRPADAPVATVPNPGGPVLIALPFDDLIQFAEQHDRLRAEVINWRESDRQQAQLAQPKPQE